MLLMFAYSLRVFNYFSVCICLDVVGMFVCKRGFVWLFDSSSKIIFCLSINIRGCLYVCQVFSQRRLERKCLFTQQ